MHLARSPLFYHQYSKHTGLESSIQYHVRQEDKLAVRKHLDGSGNCETSPVVYYNAQDPFLRNYEIVKTRLSRYLHAQLSLAVRCFQELAHVRRPRIGMLP